MFLSNLSRVGQSYPKLTRLSRTSPSLRVFFFPHWDWRVDEVAFFFRQNRRPVYCLVLFAFPNSRACSAETQALWADWLTHGSGGRVPKKCRLGSWSEYLWTTWTVVRLVRGKCWERFPKMTTDSNLVHCSWTFLDPWNLLWSKSHKSVHADLL